MTRKKPEATGWLNRDNIEFARTAASTLAQSTARVLANGSSGSAADRAAAAAELYPPLSTLSHYAGQVVPVCAGSPLETAAAQLAQAEKDATASFLAMVSTVEKRAFTAALGQLLMSATTARSRLTELERLRLENSKMRRI